MKKVISGTMTLILTLMGLVALSFASIVPASASIDDTNVTICHYNEGKKQYNQIRVSEHSIVKKTHSEGGNDSVGHGKHENDIIPPFAYNFGGSDYGDFPGLNWTPENEALWKHGNLEMTGCAPSGNPLTPVVPASPQATCVVPVPPLAETPQPAGVTYTVELNAEKTEYTVTFAKPADTAYNTYVFAEGVVNPVKVPIFPVLTTDEFWDAKTGTCKLPDTGLFGLSTEATIGGGALLALGLLFVIGNAVTRRNA